MDCWKTVLLARHTAAGRVGRRVVPESLPQRFLIATTAPSCFSRPADISLAFVALGAKQGVNPRYPRKKLISAHKCSSAVQKLICVHERPFAV
jgi:hypothetical protein